MCQVPECGGAPPSPVAPAVPPPPPEPEVEAPPAPPRFPPVDEVVPAAPAAPPPAAAPLPLVPPAWLAPPPSPRIRPKQIRYFQQCPQSRCPRSRRRGHRRCRRTFRFRRIRQRQSGRCRRNRTRPNPRPGPPARPASPAAQCLVFRFARYRFGRAMPWTKGAGWPETFSNSRLGRVAATSGAGNRTEGAGRSLWSAAAGVIEPNRYWPCPPASSSPACRSWSAW